ncbi:MAG: hypothetical protein GY952_14130 [Rhodobacteraceae bacterium]|nr:hypothetical protein [Paracoccaceae bacterium]
MAFNIAKRGDAHHGFTETVVTNDRLEEGADPEQKDQTIIDYETRACHAVSGCLQAHYPGHLWDIEVSVEGKYVAIRLPFSNVPASLPLLGLEPSLVVRAGGHMLERFSLRRGGFSMDEYYAACRADPLGYRKNTIPGGFSKGFN